MEHTFPAGKYYIGDPCYVVKDNRWSKLIEKTGCFGSDLDPTPENWDNGCFTFNGRKCFADGTRYGDGTYMDNKGRKYYVDAGLIGIMPIESVEKNKKGSGGQIVEFDIEFHVSANDGYFKFGDLIINTGDNEDEDEEEDEEVCGECGELIDDCICDEEDDEG